MSPDLFCALWLNLKSGDNCGIDFLDEIHNGARIAWDGNLEIGWVGKINVHFEVVITIIGLAYFDIGEMMINKAIETHGYVGEIL